MPKPLNVDPQSLLSAGKKIGELVLPKAPPSVSVGGTDAASAAVNSTLPQVELPVVQGLPACEAALQKTGGNIVKAVGQYKKTDQALVDILNSTQFDSSGITLGKGVFKKFEYSGKFIPGKIKDGVHVPFERIPPGQGGTGGGIVPPGLDPLVPGGKGGDVVTPITDPTTGGGETVPNTPITPSIPSGGGTTPTPTTPTTPRTPDGPRTPDSPRTPTDRPTGTPTDTGRPGTDVPGRDVPGRDGPGHDGPGRDVPGRTDGGTGDQRGDEPVVKAQSASPSSVLDDRTPNAAPGAGALGGAVPAGGGGMPMGGAPMGAMPASTASSSTPMSRAPIESAGSSPSERASTMKATSSQSPSAPSRSDSGGRAPLPTPPPEDSSSRIPVPTPQPKPEDAFIVAAPLIPVAAAMLRKDAIAKASGALRGANDPLQMARRIAAALNAPGNAPVDDHGFFWITGLTTDGSIVVANSYGLGYIPDGVQLPKRVTMATADDAIPADERARWATHPVIAVKGWADHYDKTLRAVIATAEQLGNSDPGAVKILLEPEDIPEHGRMTGLSRLEVVDPEGAELLSGTGDLKLTELLPPAPAEVDPAADTAGTPPVLDPKAMLQQQGLSEDMRKLLEELGPLPENFTPPAAARGDRRDMLWFDVMTPLASDEIGREAAHLAAFQTYAAHSEELALRAAHAAADPASQRTAVEEWMYWHHITDLLNSALTQAS